MYCLFLSFQIAKWIWSSLTCRCRSPSAPTPRPFPSCRCIAEATPYKHIALLRLHADVNVEEQPSFSLAESTCRLTALQLGLSCDIWM
jgi:hypothetical protein